MGENDLKISDSEFQGKFTGRDDKSITFETKNDPSLYLRELYLKFEEEKKQNEELAAICEEFDYFNSKVDGDVLGLDAKLIEGKRESILLYALDVKEKFHKKLLKTSQYSAVAQDINVYILSKVRRSFMTEIYSLICENESQEKINLLITERIINPVKAELGINLFKYNEDDIMGMIFFLTGNCHLKWTK